MNRPTGTNGLPEARTIRTSRAFGTARAKLWSLFENPADLSMWWGPAGFSNTFEEFDFRPGGAWRFVMRGPDGAEYPMRKRFTAIAPFERIVLDHDDPVHGFRMFMDYREEGTSTRLDWTMVFDAEEEAAKVRPFVEPANEQNFDRLEAALNATVYPGGPP